VENQKAEKLYRSSQNVNNLTYAFITARGGSKGLPGKNLYHLNGKPLISYSIESALKCSLIDKCVVSTDDADIKKVSLSYGAEVIDRPPELAADNSLSSDVVLHMLDEFSKKGKMPLHFVLLQPTSPLRNFEHVEKSLRKYFDSGYKSCISITECEHHPYKSIIIENDKIKPVFGAEKLHMPRQQLPKAYRTNGAIYICNSLDFIKYKTFYIEPVMPFTMSSEESVDIDTISDIFYAETIMRRI
jgi:N-acylneuraminate cytidylyltransferase/CMP-N,N'-diacetyllegionaminic acid synthase